MALRAEIVDFIGTYLLQDTGQVGTVRQITIMQDEARGFFVRILVNVIHALRVE